MALAMLKNALPAFSKNLHENAHTSPALFVCLAEQCLQQRHTIEMPAGK